MEPKIHDGDLCVFKAHPAGSREGKIVLAQHRETFDSETGGVYSIKKYTSEKSLDGEGGWRHDTITLLPLNHDYAPVPLGTDDGMHATLARAGVAGRFPSAAGASPTSSLIL